MNHDFYFGNPIGGNHGGERTHRRSLCKSNNPIIILSTIRGMHINLGMLDRYHFSNTKYEI